MDSEGNVNPKQANGSGAQAVGAGGSVSVQNVVVKEKMGEGTPVVQASGDENPTPKKGLVKVVVLVLVIVVFLAIVGMVVGAWGK